jgi:hypothetical protein
VPKQPKAKVALPLTMLVLVVVDEKSDKSFN